MRISLPKSLHFPGHLVDFMGSASLGQKAVEASRRFFHGGLPTDFTTIQGQVTQIEPDHGGSLKHQVFQFQEKSPQQQLLEVDNDITVGSRVPVYVGESLTIRGVLWHDPGKSGIHWTHHDNVPGDAGFIQSPDGQIYQ